MGIFTSTPPLIVTKKQPRAEKQFNPAYWKGLLESVEVARRRLSPLLARDAQKRADLGQFFTPVAVAEFMASLIRPRSDLYRVRLLDAGSGNGMLIAAAVEKMLHWETPPREIACVCWEIDPDLTNELSITLDLCRSACRARGVSFFSDLRRSDFILDASTSLKSDLFGSNDLEFDLAILNPPYRKLRTESVERIRLNRLGIETSNLYAAFMWLASKLLAAQGQLIGITPRSYMNGTYFRPFRTALLSELSVEHIHVYVARDIAFSDDEVLQENAIISARKHVARQRITITTSQGPEDDGHTSLTLDPDQFVIPGDSDRVMHVVSSQGDAEISRRMRELPASDKDLSIGVSTGRVVEFRAKDRLKLSLSAGDVPMIYPRNFEEGFIRWPSINTSKPSAIAPRGNDDPDLFPTGWYVIVKRFSPKEEKRRVVAALFDPSRIVSDWIAFDNKVNVLHNNGRGLDRDLAKGLALFLNSTYVDSYFRQFSGHTQVNAGDLRSLRFPDRNTLLHIGANVNGLMPSQEKVDQIVRENVTIMGKGTDPIAAKAKTDLANSVLKQIGVPKEQCNERSALTLLALLDLAPTSHWSSATDPLRGVTEIMGWMEAQYAKHYAPNTRETIRRYTLHQFIEIGLVCLNPDDPARPTNSPKNVYQIDPTALELLRGVGGRDFTKKLLAYSGAAEGRNKLIAAKRSMSRLPVTLPTGQTIELSAGGQNLIIKSIIEEFAPRFTPGGHVIYVGDSGEKHLLNEHAALAKLGVVNNKHDKMPDVVIHDIARNWLVLIEAVTSHGPVNALRHNQLRSLFGRSSAGLVFVTAFADRTAMRAYLSEIAWETEVWVADAPDHLIHFNGERFLGPYLPQ